MAKIRIPVENLPPPDSNGEHVLQFRVVSEDRNRISAWSPLYVVKSIGQYRPVESDVTAVVSEKDVSITWDTPIAYNNVANANSSVLSTAVQTDNKIIAVGWFSMWNSTLANKIVRLNSNGSVDEEFMANVSSSVSHRVVEDVLIQSDGKIVLAGWFRSWSGSSANRVVRLNSDGTVDNSFAVRTGGGINDYAKSAGLQSDSKIVVGGAFTSWSGASANRVVRLNGNGTVDTSFVSNIGSAANDSVRKVFIQSDGKIIVGGYFTTWNSSSANYVVRLNSDGTLDTTFRTNIGTGPNGSVENIATQSDGKIIIGGQFTSWNGTSINRIVRLNSDGTIDTTFTTNIGTAANSLIYSLAVQSDNKILVGGLFTIWNGVSSKNIVRLNSDGTLDTSFVTNAGDSIGFNEITYTIDSMQGITVQRNGKIILAGGFTNWNKKIVNRFVILNSDGTSDESFLLNGGTNSNSIIHNHSQSFKQHDADIFLQWDGGDIEYHNRVSSDTTNVIIPSNSASVRAIGISALKDIPQKGNFETTEDYKVRLQNYLGIGSRKNLIPNPNFETNLTGWTGTNFTSSQSSTYAKYGTYSWKGVVLTTGTNRYMDKLQSDVFISSGKTYTYSCWVYLPATNTADVTLGLWAYAWNSTGYQAGPTVLETKLITRGTWTRLSGTFTPLNGTTGPATNVLLRVINQNSWAAGQEMYVDGAMLEESSNLDFYFDGTSMDGVNVAVQNRFWNGSLNNSTSTLNYHIPNSTGAYDLFKLFDTGTFMLS